MPADVIAQLIERLTAAEARLAKLETQEQLRFVPLAAPLTSTSWDGDAKATTDSASIDLSSVFGAPAGIKAVYVEMEIADASVGTPCSLAPTATYVGTPALTIYTYVANQYSAATGIIPCDANGDIYFKCWSNTDNVTIRIWGYWI